MYFKQSKNHKTIKKTKTHQKILSVAAALQILFSQLPSVSPLRLLPRGLPPWRLCGWLCYHQQAMTAPWAPAAWPYKCGWPQTGQSPLDPPWEGKTASFGHQRSAPFSSGGAWPCRLDQRVWHSCQWFSPEDFSAEVIRKEILNFKLTNQWLLLISICKVDTSLQGSVYFKILLNNKL